ncbi:hypothetical protein BCR33DRAFT_191702 [Rhizoclosmatium globosum]|uniref:Uncharacterized protein n=1 Tax=Rhizoclosmatium globosum TaxID=329046 RepID=A0A1Y2D1T8_9FUNG|nr:hypothetical protein BCR33DRAFT_191702 [Rhizoclosmatium globosum]|eukprot:ORY53251.1 hypothetical protein BCR33DRAFT_191702 [Rhizoclosmatium globosum]
MYFLGLLILRQVLKLMRMLEHDFRLRDLHHLMRAHLHHLNIYAGINAGLYVSGKALCVCVKGASASAYTQLYASGEIPVYSASIDTSKGDDGNSGAGFGLSLCRGDHFGFDYILHFSTIDSSKGTYLHQSYKNVSQT